MSVIGIDFGNDSCYIAVARAGGIETIANDYSLRATPSCVAFGEHNRILGVAAKNQLVTNMKNTIYGFKRLMGRNYTDPGIQEEIAHLSYQVIATQTGNMAVKVRYLNEERTFGMEQITGMLFTKLKEIAEAALQIKVIDCVISVPVFFSESERRSVLDAASIAGLNVLRLMNEPLAVALAYGIYKQDLPAPEEKPRNVIFVDCGQSALQVAACAFNKGKLKMLACAWDSQLGGRDIDLAIAEKMASDFTSRYKLDTKGSPRAWARLLGECEKLKKQMSANSTQLPLNIECFLDDVDVHSSMKRTDMEELVSPLFGRFEATLRRCLEMSRLGQGEIGAIEIVGGSTRVSAFKQTTERVFGLTCSTTLNQDEAVARGCALQCAMLSPAFKVREFSITDVQPYAVRLAWDAALGDEGEVEVYPSMHPVPFSKMLSFYQKQGFTLRAFYSSPSPVLDPAIGTYAIQEVRPDAEGESQKVKVKLRVNIHGLFSVKGATLMEARKETDTPPAGETASSQPDADPGNGSSEAASVNSADSTQESDMAPSDTQEGSDAKRSPSGTKEAGKKGSKKGSVRSVDLPVEASTHGMGTSELDSAMESEGKMAAQDKMEKERVDAKNALEEYVYELRGRVGDPDDLQPYLGEDERTALMHSLDDTETWLYEEGEDQAKHTYHDRLTQLRKVGECAKRRKEERVECPLVLEELGGSLQRARKAVEQWRGGEERLAHLDRDEIGQVDKAIQASQAWLDQHAPAFHRTPNHLDAQLTSQQVKQQIKTLEGQVLPILNKPKPKSEVPPQSDQSGPPPSGPGGAQEGHPNPPQTEGGPQPNSKGGVNGATGPRGDCPHDGNNQDQNAQTAKSATNCTQEQPMDLD